jgi:thiamine-phosphate pyrophosphorylase
MGSTNQLPGTAVPSPRIRTLQHQLRVVAITDRHQMVDAHLLASNHWPTIATAYAHAIQRAISGCAPNTVLLQIREKDLDGGPLLQLVRAAQPFAPVVVNDRIDVALAADAHGVHLPERGIPLDDARALAPTLAIGVSRHAPPLDDDADIIHLGPIWPTPSKPTTSPLGTSVLATPHGAAILVAVGGIDSPDRAHRAVSAGADAVAVIRAAWTGTSLASFVAAVEAGRTPR